ncbi:hypothetical protein ABZU32_12075 [Sphaerisporangium sp. NPDC005288]|uniref:hypothetical protein n=1 Tax=Sphaerisporangium sp. NPDC005288 TaxID=3155114 RepID=UPI0033B0F0A1
MSERLDDLERRIDALRREIRRAVRARENVLARSLRAELRRAEQAWDQALADDEAPGGDPAPGSLLPIREQVHQALTLLGVPAAARVVVAVHTALRAGSLRGSQLTSLRRDEERSFRGAPFTRPYYLCAALTDRLSASRGLLAVSTWPLERRVIGPLSPRVDFLTTAIRVAEHVERSAGAGGHAPPGARRLLARLAHNIPGAGGGPRTRGLPPVDVLTPAGPFGEGFDGPDPADVVRAARAELEVHAAADAAARAEIAGRARERLADAERLFGGATLRVATA